MLKEWLKRDSIRNIAKEEVATPGLLCGDLLVNIYLKCLLFSYVLDNFKISSLIFTLNSVFSHCLRKFLSYFHSLICTAKLTYFLYFYPLVWFCPIFFCFLSLCFLSLGFLLFQKMYIGKSAKTFKGKITWG